MRVLVALSLLKFAIVAAAQNSTTSITNFYSVTGTNFREIRESIVRSRPWKDPFDGETRWDVRWKLQYAQRGGVGCAITSFSVTTRITITLPRWTPPAGVDPKVKEQWTRYFTALARHEAGHARLASAAGDEVAKKMSEVSAQAECAILNKTVDEQAQRVVDDCRIREKEYDRRTNHGANPSGIP